MNSTADAIIIGSGVIGTAIALELAKKGCHVLSIDSNPEAGHGPTSGSCAIVRVHYSTMDGTAMAWEGYHYWKEWESYIGGKDPRGMAEFRETGCLVMRTPENKMLNTHIENSRTLKIPFEIWDREQILNKLPIYNLKSYSPPRLLDDDHFGQSNGSEVSGGVYWPTAGYVTDPKLSAQNMQWAAENNGAKFLFGQTVVDIIKSSGRVGGVKLKSGEEIHAPVVINVAGAHSSGVNKMAGVLNEMTISTRALKQEVAHVPAPEGFDFYNDGLVVSDSDIGCYVRPEQGNHILIGSEDPDCDPKEFVDPASYERNFTDQWTVQVHRYAQRVPTLGIPSKIQGVVDLYDVTEDWIPIYDASSLAGYYMAIGTSGNQYKNAPPVGKMVASLIEYCESGGNHDAEPHQFTLPYIGQEIDVRFYSRKREINSESSFSVLG